MSGPLLGERIGSGKEAEVFAFGADVVKLYPAGTGKEATFREAANLALAERLALPAPRVVSAGLFGDRWGVAMTRAAGPSFGERALGEPGRLPALVTAGARLQLAMHAAPGAGLPGLKQRLAGRITAAGGLARSRRESLLDALGALPEGDRVCHGDFHLMNILGSADAPVIVDWVDACCGHPAADCCRSHLLLGGWKPEVAALHLASYCSFSGRAEAEILAWLPVLAGARLAENVTGETERLLALVDGL